MHWSFLLVPPAIVYFSYRDGLGIVSEALTWYASVAVLLFAFVLVHELGHALVARGLGVRADKIVLFPLGGGAFIPERPKRTLHEVAVYAAGPVANLLLAGLAVPILLAQPDGELILRSYVSAPGNYVVAPSLLDRLLGVSVAVNVLLAAGNLLPAFPLDGGRILRALLNVPLGERQATVIVSILGVVIGAGLLILSYRMGDPLLGLGACFVAGMSAVAYRDGWQRRRLDKMDVSTVLRPYREGSMTLYPTQSARTALVLFDRTDWPVLPVFDNWNELRGFVAREVVEEEDPRGRGTVRHVAELEYVTARPEDNLLDVTERIVEANVYGAAVYGPRGELRGFVFTEDVMGVLGKG